MTAFLEEVHGSKSIDRSIFSAMPSSSKPKLIIKVGYLRRLLKKQGVQRRVSEYELRSLAVLWHLHSVSAFLDLAARKTFIWLSRDIFFVKRCTRLDDALLTALRSFRIVFFSLTTCDGRKIECQLYWRELAVDFSPMNSFLRLLAKDSSLTVIDSGFLGNGTRTLPVSSLALEYFFAKAACCRTVSFSKIKFTTAQCPALFSREDGTVVIAKIDVRDLEDEGSALVQAVTENVGVSQLNIVGVERMHRDSFKKLMSGLCTNRLVKTLRISQSTLSDYHVQGLCRVLNRNKSITHFKCSCGLSDSHWKSVWAAMEHNATIVSIDIQFTWHHLSFRSQQRKYARDMNILSTLATNTVLEDIVFTQYEHVGNFMKGEILPMLEKNLYRRYARDLSKEPNHCTRWALLGRALCHPRVRTDPAMISLFLSANRDSFAENVPKGKDMLLRILRKLDLQRAEVLEKLRDYELLETTASCSRKRKRDNHDDSSWNDEM